MRYSVAALVIIVGALLVMAYHQANNPDLIGNHTPTPTTPHASFDCAVTGEVYQLTITNTVDEPIRVTTEDVVFYDANGAQTGSQQAGVGGVIDVDQHMTFPVNNVVPEGTASCRVVAWS